MYTDSSMFFSIFQDNRITQLCFIVYYSTVTWNSSNTVFHCLIVLFLPYRLINTFDFKDSFKNRTPAVQGGFQAAAMCVAVCFGIGGGIFVGMSKYNRA